MIIGNKEFDIKNNTYIMGILNVTPDSFSDGGKWNNLDKALKRAEEMIEQGADIIDIGGESTRPGHIAVTEEEENNRVLKVIENVKNKFDIPVSIDTYKSGTALRAINCGADMINDIWGFKFDPNMAGIVASQQKVCCLVHNASGTIQDVKEDLIQSINIALYNGISADKIITDPGIGFGKTYNQNVKIINELDKLQDLGYPVLLGASRKSVIQIALNLSAMECIEGTLVTTVMAVMKGCSFIRVHDVKENKRAVQMAERILNG